MSQLWHSRKEIVAGSHQGHQQQDRLERSDFHGVKEKTFISNDFQNILNVFQTFGRQKTHTGDDVVQYAITWFQLNKTKLKPLECFHAEMKKTHSTRTGMKNRKSVNHHIWMSFAIIIIMCICVCDGRSACMMSLKMIDSGTFSVVGKRKHAVDPLTIKTLAQIATLSKKDTKFLARGRSNEPRSIQQQVLR
jgi:hypothetical protein